MNEMFVEFQVRVFSIRFRGAGRSGQSLVRNVAGADETGRLGCGPHQSLPQILPRRVSSQTLRATGEADHPSPGGRSTLVGQSPQAEITPTSSTST